MSIFKANDIRGRYPEEWDGSTAYRIGLALAEIFEGNRIVIGRDGRSTSKEIFTFLTKGMMERGMNISDMGMVDTPAVYFAVGKYGFDGGIMITASHNPVGYNGIKITGRNAVPVEYATGIRRIENLVEEFNNDKGNIQKYDHHPGFTGKFDIKKSYLEFLNGFKGDFRGIKAVFDCSNGTAGCFAEDMLHDFSGNAEIINDRVDGEFPAHGPNPSAEGSLDQVKELVLNSGADIGFCFDGDADRVVMIDDRGNSVSPDIITAVMGLYFFRNRADYISGKNKVLIDIRSSNSVGEFLQNIGAVPVTCPVGHAKIKKMLREENAFYGGELTGHYYYRANFFCDSAWITVFTLLNVLSVTGEKLSVLSSKIMKYAFSGEISYPVGDQKSQEDVLLRLKEKYSDASIDSLDGLRFDYPGWWFIVRKSGTEPFLRLVVETETQEELNKKLESITEEISKSVR